MDQAEARRRLGVGARASASEVRAAFRRRLLGAHPDLMPGDPAAGPATAALVEAYAALRRSPPADPPTPPADAVAPETMEPEGRHLHAEVVTDGDSVHVAGPPDEVYRRVVEVAHLIGEITYVDPDARLLDVIVTTDAGVACSLLASFQGRSSHTEVFFSLEPLGGDVAPSVGPYVAALATLLAAPGALRPRRGGGAAGRRR